MRNKLTGLVFILCITGTSLFGQSIANYVVIGAFAVESHARVRADSARQMHFDVHSALNKNRSLFYVYVLKTDDRKAAFAEAVKLQAGSPFRDTWVYTGSFEIQDKTVSVDSSPTMNNVKADVPAGTGIQTIDPVVEKITSLDSVLLAVPGAKKFYFLMESADDKTVLQGDVDVINVDRATRFATYQGNTEVAFRPVNSSGNVSFVCSVVGFRKLQKDVNLNLPADSLAIHGLVEADGKTTVTLDLVRLKKGDIAVLYHVYFFKDAAVIRPESKFEVVALASMMKENPKFKIRIHGHTNGNSAGKLITVGPDLNFFSMTGAIQGLGSAKDLSERRAELVRDFLISEGIDAGRMEVKAWGGKKAIYDKFSDQAQANVRVEIEILDDK